jgi:hypothetical protein
MLTDGHGLAIVNPWNMALCNITPKQRLFMTAWFLFLLPSFKKEIFAFHLKVYYYS